MRRLADRCDLLDVLEEAAVTQRPVSIEVRGGPHFDDHVVDVVTEAGEDFVVFRAHGRFPVSEIASGTPIGSGADEDEVQAR